MSRDNLHVCIIMTTYNGERFIAKQIESILDQSYQDFELHVYDDASLDTTAEIVKSYAAEHNCITFYQNESNIGVVQNIENALKMCQGQYIALSDQDDIWHKDKLLLLADTLKKMEIRYPGKPLLVHSDLEMIDENEQQLHSSYFSFRGYQFPAAKALNTIMSQNGVMGNTVLFNSVLKQLLLPFPKHLVVHDYWIALINEMYGKRVTVHKPLVQYRIHDTNLSNRAAVFQNRKWNFISKMMSRDFNLPYMGINRDKVLRELMERYELIEDDKVIMEKFLTYLEFKSNRLTIFYTLVKYGFIKKGFFYRVKVFFKLLITGKYSD